MILTLNKKRVTSEILIPNLGGRDGVAESLNILSHLGFFMLSQRFPLVLCRVVEVLPLVKYRRMNPVSLLRMNSVYGIFVRLNLFSIDYIFNNIWGQKRNWLHGL